MPQRKKAVKEPVQVYLDAQDRSLLDAMAKQASVSRAELLRLALRRLSAEMLADKRAGSSLAALRGALDKSRDLPTDLAARHDEYLYPESDDG